jgi:gamma-glutamylcyclotransferase (GGCT)/AIG2-like uncharacterized protein YtfP
MEQLPFFVYGTLRRGEGNHRLVQADLEDVREARLPGHVLYAQGLPYIGPSDSLGTVVVGDLLLIRPDWYGQALRALDRLEGYDPPRRAMYVRTRVCAEFSGGPDNAWLECDAWAYLGGDSFPCDPGLVIPSGDWADVRRFRSRGSRPAVLA